MTFQSLLNNFRRTNANNTQGTSSSQSKDHWYAITGKFIYGIAGHPLYGVVVGLATLIAGAMASLFSPEIKTYFTDLINKSPRLTWLTHFQNRGLALVFIFCVGVWVSLYFLRQIAASKSLNALRQSAERISEAVFTLPPSNFLKAFSEETTSIYSRLLSSLPRHVKSSTTQKELEQLIRSLLNVVARLANAYDPERRARYAANIMIYIPSADQAPYFPTKYTKEKIRQFLQKIHDPENLEGILVLQKDLSSTADGSQPDETLLQDVIFGIPKVDDKDGKEPLEIAPGAARAFYNWRNEKIQSPTALRHAIHGVDDIWNLTKSDLQRNHCTLSDEVIEKLHDFYRREGPGERIVSFQAYPLVLSDTERTAIGVLNIHCDKPIFLGPFSPQDASRRQQTYAGIITPLVFEIANAVRLWWEIKKD